MLSFEALTPKFHRQFFTWVIPILFVHFLFFFLAAFCFRKRYFGTCQILLSVLGLYWCFSNLWVETLLGIWYPDFDYQSPPTFQDPRPGRQSPYCDIATWARCSVAIMSPYNRLLSHFGLADEEGWMDFANATIGVPFYAMHILCVLFEACRNMEKKRNRPYHRYSWNDPEPGCCDCCEFRCVMLVLTCCGFILGMFQAWKFTMVLREFSIVHAGSWTVNLCLIVACLHPVEEDEDDKDKKKLR